MNANEFHLTIGVDEIRAIDALVEHSGLPKQRLKDAMNKGAVWLKQQGKRAEQRLRRATKTLRRGDALSLYYDSELLARSVPEPQLIADERLYSVWHKPAGMLAQGTRFGDHCALLRWCEQRFPGRACFLIHRLDREAEGLMLIAHQQKAAHLLSTLWQQQRISKHYEVLAEGNVGDPGHSIHIHAPLDGKDSATTVTVRGFDRDTERSVLDITLITGRKHQIRRHLAGIDHPVVGDYRYGARHRGENLALRAVALRFQCPLSKRERDYRIDNIF